MKNVSLHCTTVLKLYTHGSDDALNAAADCDTLGNHAAIDRCAIADQEVGSAQLAFNSAEDLSWAIAFDVTDDRHAGPDARVRSRFPRRRRLGSWRDLFNDCVRRLHCPSHEFVRICRRVPVLLGCLALEATQHVNLPSCRCDARLAFTRVIRPFLTQLLTLPSKQDRSSSFEI